MVEALAYTSVAVALYFVSDWILQRVEVAYGRRLEYRTLIFFAILSVLALASFALIRRLLIP
ncbi:MAG: hypothetical protein R3268_10855 [Acidiferrobacterales bacterium]|nr:hypothetical protein [Acidiferrobacterales bacterium]